MDEAFAYFWRDDQFHTMKRISLRTGLTDIPFSRPTNDVRQIMAVTSDACNIYWGLSNPVQIWTRAK